MTTALKLSQIYLDLVFGVHKFKYVPQKAFKDNHSMELHSESSESPELRSTSASIKSTTSSFLFSISIVLSRLENDFSCLLLK